MWRASMLSEENSDFLLSSSSTSEESSRHGTSDTENDATLESFREKADSEKGATTDEGLAQIRASTTEVRRRISAFMSSKRMEVSDNNIREFCFDLPSYGVNGEEENSCARVDSMFVSRGGSCSHLRVSRVHNTLGPQTQARHADSGGGRLQAGRSTPTLYKSSVEERLRNAEQHLSITSDNKANLFSRLKAVEESILFLNGLSPEYFDSGKIPQHKGKRKRIAEPEPAPEEPCPAKLKTEYDNISEIDQRILTLRTKLKEKMKPWSP